MGAKFFLFNIFNSIRCGSELAFLAYVYDNDMGQRESKSSKVFHIEYISCWSNTFAIS